MEAMEEAPVAQEQQEQMEVAAGEGEAGGPIPLSALQVGFFRGGVGVGDARRSPSFSAARCRPLQRKIGGRGCKASFWAPSIAPRPLPLSAPILAFDLAQGEAEDFV
jgi:hypothetical protein